MSMTWGTDAYGRGRWYIETLSITDPKFMSFKTQLKFYNLVMTNVDKDEFVVNGHKPQKPMREGACDIDFQYDVVLLEKPLCTVYQANCVSGGVNFYVLEFQGEHYEPLTLLGGCLKTGVYKGEQICERIACRWQADEKKRAEQTKKATEQSHLNFLASFSSAVQHS